MIDKVSLTVLRRDMDKLVKQMVEFKKYSNHQKAHLDDQYEDMVRQRRLLNERISLRERGLDG